MAAAESSTLSYVDPLLQTMGKEIHIIPGGAGMGSTVKMVHQLLAGVHIVVAAEALALAAKAGLDVEQMYDIVKGAAGSSWMFCDRGRRMFDNEDDKVMSALGIFIKDLDIGKWILNMGSSVINQSSLQALYFSQTLFSL